LLARKLGHCHQTGASTAATPARAGMSHDPEAPELKVSFRGPQTLIEATATPATGLQYHVK